jgi:hypothetical protein
MAEKEEARLELQKEEEISLPSCSYYLDRAVYCISKYFERKPVLKTCYLLSPLCIAPGHQMTYYYRRGEADRCKGTWSDFMHCLRAKSMAEEEGLVCICML